MQSLLLVPLSFGVLLGEGLFQPTILELWLNYLEVKSMSKLIVLLCLQVLGTANQHSFCCRFGRGDPLYINRSHRIHTFLFM